MIKENNVVPLFGIPLCQTQIKPYEESEKFIKEKLDYELRSHKVSYISKDDYVLDKDNLLPLKMEILQQVSEFMHGYLDVHEKHKFILTTSWCNKYEQNQYIQEHYHSNSLISGVLIFLFSLDWWILRNWRSLASISNQHTLLQLVFKICKNTELQFFHHEDNFLLFHVVWPHV